MSERIINEAEEIGRKYAKRKAREAVDDLQRQKHGTGCGCKNCVTRAVRNANQWSDFLTKGTNPTEAFVKWEKGLPTVGFRENKDVTKKLKGDDKPGKLGRPGE